jgi:transcriptional regulator with XRE-family HTH domain
MTRAKRQGESLYDRRASTKQGRLGLAAAKAALRVAELLNAAKTASRQSSKAIASELNVTEGRVSQVLNGDGNLHIASVARYLAVCGYELKLIAEPLTPDRPRLERKRPGRTRDQAAAHDTWDVFEQLYLTRDSVRKELAAFHRPAGPRPIPLGEPKMVGEIKRFEGGKFKFNPVKDAAEQWLTEVQSADQIEEENRLPGRR